MIFITGDTHGHIDYSKLNTSNWPEQRSLTKEDFLIIAGDVAMRWYDAGPDGSLAGEDRDLIDWYNNKSFTTLFIDGNHENHNALNSYPVTMWNGGKVHQIADSVYHLMRGQVFTIDGSTFFTMGGAASTDRYNRVEGKSWWPGEMPSESELMEGIDNLTRYGMNVDYVITHCCGKSLFPLLFGYNLDSDTLTSYFDHLEFDYKLQFKHWYFGHYHKDRTIDNRYTCLYRAIERII